MNKIMLGRSRGEGGGFEGLGRTPPPPPPPLGPTDIAGGHGTIYNVVEVTLLYHYSVTAALPDFTGDNQPTFDM